MIPSFEDRQPEQIITDSNYFESSGRIYKALSWLDYAKRNTNVSALEYAALETRLGIEQLLFEQLVVGVGSEIEQQEYKKCKGNAKVLDQILKRLIPKYEKLVDFTRALAPDNIPISKWDNHRLIQYSGKVSTYLHWSGGLDTTVQSEKWFANGIQTVQEAANYVWETLTKGNTAVMNIEDSPLEIQDLWEQYSGGQTTLESAASRAEILEPILQERLTNAGKGRS
ncbi:hypothetical protein SAMN04487958_1206 [Vreelandella subterranea]|uniref:Uncharacterized protein n=1 Tax=Vreelandella subterranea TaxID=416874 RepID=A0A1H9WQS3_9GAMM|nr:hypothetical protein [Halomonas subterranea]SES36139.1 hypothetical protein SAMN04487958_1206 [Halomonas subterranea]